MIKIFGIITCCLLSYTFAIDHSFVDVDTDLHKVHRNLLQDDTISDSIEDEGPPVIKDETTTEEPVVIKGLAEPGESKLGPRLYYDGKEFLMRLGSPIRVTIFPGAESDEKDALATVDLDQEAVSIMGSMISSDTFKVNIDWKSHSFGDNFKVKTVQIHMYFVKTKDEYYMSKLEVIGITVNGQQMHKNELDVKTKNGHKVIAPLGASFCCYDPGMFEPKKDASEQQVKNPFSIGLTFPKMQLQVFGLERVRFGPEWTCDMFMSIGLWVGLLVSLLFASICVWGFCMLGNISTMDRFDDPRGKSIHVPQTD